MYKAILQRYCCDKKKKIIAAIKKKKRQKIFLGCILMKVGNGIYNVISYNYF